MWNRPGVAALAQSDQPVSEPRESSAANRQRVGIVVDAACDLPDDFFDNPDVAVIPVTIRVGDTVYVDQHAPESTLRFMREHGDGSGANAESSPLSVPEMQALFMERFALDYDSVYCLTITSSRSPIHDHAMQASTRALQDIRNARNAAGIARPYQFRVIDTKNMFAAQGVSALVLRDLLRSGLPAKDVRDALYKVIDATFGYLIVDDLGYMRKRARARGDRSIGLASAVFGNALDIKPIVRGRLGTTTPVGKFRGREESWNRLLDFTAKHVQRGLVAPHVVVSYGGPLNDVYDMYGFRQLQAACDNEGVQLHTCQMSISGMVNMGVNALCVGFAAEEHSPNF